MAKSMNTKRLLWANDFPHTDSTWPHSQELLFENTATMDDSVLRDIVHENTAKLYNLHVS
jgi:predicted TIM-barrel fold metal-dependent hydrolase